MELLTNTEVNSLIIRNSSNRVQTIDHPIFVGYTYE